MSDKMTLLHQAILTVHGSLSKSKIVLALLGQIRSVFAAEESVVLLPNPQGHHRYDVFSLKAGVENRLKRTRLLKLQGLEKWVCSTGKPLLIPGRDHFLQELLVLREQSLFQAPNLIAAAMKTGTRARGVLLALNASNDHRFSPQDLEFLQQLADHAAQALDNAGLFESQRAFSLELRRQVKATTSQLRSANETLRQADLAKSELISTVAHELRTPITSITGFSKLLLRGKPGPLSEEQAQFCQIIHKNSENLEHLITDLLDITKLEQGRLEMRSETLSLNALIKESVLPLQAALPEHERRLSVILPEQAITVRGDRMRLLQVINNLLSNAHKYSPPGTPIRIRLETDEVAAVFSVENQGCTLTSEQLVKVFEKFYRVKNHSTRNISGSGLGLAIAKSIIQAHGGSIWASNTSGIETVFHFTLPLFVSPLEAPKTVE